MRDMACQVVETKITELKQEKQPESYYIFLLSNAPQIYRTLNMIIT